jgi:hypothetical protein
VATFGNVDDLRPIFLNRIGRTDGKFTDVAEFCDDGVGEREAEEVCVRVLLEVLEGKDGETAGKLRELGWGGPVAIGPVTQRGETDDCY